MQIFENNINGKNQVSSLTEQHLREGWTKEELASRFDKTVILKKDVIIGKVSKVQKIIKITFVELTGEIIVNEISRVVTNAEKVKDILKYYLNTGHSIDMSKHICLTDGLLDGNDILNFEEVYDYSALLLN